MTTQTAALKPPLSVQESRPALEGARVVSASMLASGALIYAFHVAAARTLGGAAYGQIAVLWGAMFIVAIVLFRPLEQTTARALADRRARGEEVRTVLRSVTVLCVCLLAGVGAVAASAWTKIGDALFLGDSTMTAMLVVGIAAYGAAYLSRGIVTGTRWFAGYGIGLLADAVARLAIAVPLVWVASKGVAAAAVAVAGLVGALVPLWVGRGRIREALPRGHGARFRLGSTVAFAAPATVIAAADQLLVNGSPLLVIVGGGREASKVAGVVFAATMLVRVPVYVFQGLAASILPNLTRLHALDDPARFRRDVLHTAGLLLAAGGAIVAFAGAIGPESMRLVYGAGFDAGRLELVLLGAGVACYLGATTFSQALLALDRSVAAGAAWAATAVTFVGGYALAHGEALMRISVAFTAATLLGLVLLSGLLVHRTMQR